MTTRTTDDVKCAARAVTSVAAELGFADRLGGIKARLGIGRMDYRVKPGLYAIGEPTTASVVLVSANYKLSFDHLRREMSGRDAWILVLDTQGINVWCAAGKGTFGTDELVRSIEAAHLEDRVSHRKLVLPQLGAPGVNAPEVRKRSGFRVVYGPVRAADLPAFLDAGMKASPQMRRVRFGLRDRLVLIPVELVMGARYALLAAAAFLLLGGLGSDGYSLAGVRTVGVPSAAVILLTFLGAAVLGPALLPWLPGRAFSAKGAALGVVGVAIAGWTVWPAASSHWLHGASWVLLVPALASFVVMGFTGASTFTSLSGVVREMRFAVPAQIASATIGVGLWLTGLFLHGGTTS